MPSVRAPSTVASSVRAPSRSPSPDRDEDPSEVTNLLPPTSGSSAHGTPNLVIGSRGSARKQSVGQRSVSGRSTVGSVRGYGAAPITPGPVHQAPRVSKAGQRRVLTTLPIQASFFCLVFLTFLSVVTTLIFFLNTGMDLSGIMLPYRGSGFVEFWISALGSWVGLGALISFSHPAYLFFLTNLLTFIIHIPLFLLAVLSPSLRHTHLPLIFVPFGVTALTVLFSLLSNYLVRRARRQEGQRIQRMLTDAAARERGRGAGDRHVSRALVGVQEKGVWGRLVGFFRGILGFVIGLAGLGLVVLLVIDLSITAFDSSVELPSTSSRFHTVMTPDQPWSIQVHLACVEAQNSSRSHAAGSSAPTVLYEPPSGVPGSLALLETPLPPSDETAHNPGRWLLDMQERGEIGKVCVWDRPGYGFSDVLVHADLGQVADVLWQALKEQGETRDSKFMLVGEGYGGLLTRVFASRHASKIHSIIHLEAQTATTYFSESPSGRGPIRLLAHRIATRLLPSLLTPLSIYRLPSALLRRSDSLSRILASTHPLPSTERLNQNLQKARLQETFGSHSHTSESFQALLASGHKYPADVPAIVISSLRRITADEEWAEGQRQLAEEVTSKDGLVDWVKVKGVGHHVCASREQVCEKAVKKLLKA